MKDLTSSPIDRKNILNNELALSEISQRLSPTGFMFEGSFRFTKAQVARFFDVDVRTIERLLEQHGQELYDSGYELVTGKKLRELKEVLSDWNARQTSQLTDIDVGQLNDIVDGEEIGHRARSLSVFTYKAFLNAGMLLTDSERARELRSASLSIVLDVLHQRLGGSTKYINQREEEYLPSSVREHNYRQEFTNTLDACIGDNKFKYGQLTDRIYVSIFHENAKEYKQVLKLKPKESVRETMYSEVLDLIASYENGFAKYLCQEKERLERQLRLSEANELFKKFEREMAAVYQPFLEKARGLMASRDMAFRDALHEKLKDYVGAITPAEFDKFLGEKSRELAERLIESQEVFKRLKDR